METTSKISTISYNTDIFLQDTLNSLINGGLIEWWVYINHKPEKSENKAHKHLIIQPSKRLDTTKLRMMFQELVPGEDKPLGVMPFQKSRDFDNWYWYALHDAVFLKSKGEKKEFEYHNRDLICNDVDMLNNLIADVKPTKDMIEGYIFKTILDNPKCNWSKVFEENGLAYNKWRYMRECINFALSDYRNSTLKGNGFERIADDDCPWVE